MRRTGCGDLAELRSALVGGSLTDTDRDRVLNHLAGCSGCRRDVVDLRDLRRRLEADCGRLNASPALASRLRSIGRTPSPPRRRRRMRRGGLVVGAVLTATVAAGGVGYAAAPDPPDLLVGDPSGRVRAAHSTAWASLPLADEAMSAVLAESAELRTDGDPVGRPVPTAGRGLSAVEALAVLERARQAAGEVTYSGVQTVAVGRGAQAVAAEVRIDASVGHRTAFEVYSTDGQWVRAGTVPARSAGVRAADRAFLTSIGSRYRLSGRTAVPLAGRSATVVEAATPGATLGATPASISARWWVDDATGLLLGRETYNAAGAVTLASAFTSVRVREGPGRAGPPVEAAGAGIPDESAPSTSGGVPPAQPGASLTLSAAPALSDQGWFCPQSLAGLPLVRVRRGGGAAEELQLVYSDGIGVISVLEQPGRLPEALPGWRRDSKLSALVRGGTPRLATRQVGGTVITVATGVREDLLAAAVSSVPVESALSRTTMGRVQAGWARILDSLTRDR